MVKKIDKAKCAIVSRFANFLHLNLSSSGFVRYKCLKLNGHLKFFLDPKKISTYHQIILFRKKKFLGKSQNKNEIKKFVFIKKYPKYIFSVLTSCFMFVFDV